MATSRSTTKSCECLQRLCFGFGHVHNDLCAAVWFSYTLFYLQIVIEIDSTTAGLLVMLGQVVDAVATPAAGWAVDRIGSQRAWHIAGSIMVTIGFLLIFSITPGINWLTLLRYAVAISLFQIGWATVQISHLSIIPTIARDHSHSSDLTTIRYIASVCCGITVYLIAWVVLKNNENVKDIGPGDFSKFQKISVIVSIIGVTTSLLFYCGVRVTQRHHYEVITNDEISFDTKIQPNRKTLENFLKNSVIYRVSILYMTSRLYTILNLIYIPLYLNERQDFLAIGGIRETIASVPLASFISSFLTSVVLKLRGELCGDKLTYLLGSIFSLGGCLWIALGIAPDSNIQIYCVASFIGIGSSATMVASLCLTAEFVETNAFKSGLVYSTVTFTDKIISGGIVLITQYLDCDAGELCPNFYRYVLAYACGATTIIGLIALLSLNFRTAQLN